MLKNEEENTIRSRCRECETDKEKINACDDAPDSLIADATDRIQLCKMLKQQAIKRWTHEIKQTDK